MSNEEEQMETYEVSMVCTNCAWIWRQELEKGVPARGDLIECPKCGCRGTAERNFSV